MSRPLPALGKLHPLTGAPIMALGFRRDGRPIFPIMGGDPSNDPPERPEEVSEEEWESLGDPGKQALIRVRQERDDARREAAAAKAKPKPPAAPVKPAGQTTDTGTGDEPDVAKLIQSAVAAAIKPFEEREQQRDAQAAAQAVRDAVVTAAKDKLHDGTDGLMIDLTTVVGEDGTPDAKKIEDALDALVKAKPHLAKDTRRFAVPGVGPSAGGGEVPMKDRVQNVLAQMQSATGVRIPKSE